MNISAWKRIGALTAALLLLSALPVAAEPAGEPTDTTTTVETTTTTMEQPTTTTVSETTTTEATTTTTQAATTTTTVATVTTVTKRPAVTTTATTVAPKTTTVGSVKTTVTNATTTVPSTVPSAPADTQPVEIAEPYVIVGEPGGEHSYVYFCDTDGHYPADILNGDRYEGYTDDWWVAGRNGGLAIQLDSAKGRYLRCSRYLFSNQQNGTMSAFTLSMWVNWQADGEDDASLGQKLLCLSTQDLDDKWHSGDRLQWDPDTWYAFVSPHMRDNETGLDGIYVAFVNENLYESDEDFTPAQDDTTFALPTNEWHHVAVTMSDSELVLYVDGHRLYACSGTTELTAMAPYLDRFFIGRGMEGDPTLDALIDDALLYPQVLSAEHIALLAADRDPASGGTAPSHPEYKPTRPATSGTAAATAATTARVSRPQADGGDFPVVMVAIPAAIVLITVVLSLVLSPKKAKPEESTDAPDDEEEAEETAAEEPIVGEIRAEEPIEKDTEIAQATIEPEEDA